MNENYLTVKEYSEKYKITKQAIYSKIKRGILKDKIVNDVKVILDDRIKPIDNNIAQNEKIEKSEIYNQYPKNNIEQQLNNNIESNSNAEKSEVKNDFLKETTSENIGTDMVGENIYDCNFPEKFNLILGNEGNGIRPEVEKLLSKNITIPRFGKTKSTESLNVSMATSIILGQIFSKK